MKFSKSSILRFSLFGFLFASFIACINGTDPEEPPETLNGLWELYSYTNSNGTIETQSPDIQRPIKLTFNDDRKKGTLKGHTVSNDVSGKYSLYPGNKITVHRFGGTKEKVAEPPWGEKFWRVIIQSKSYQLSDTSLSIFYNDGKGTGQMTFFQRYIK